MPSFVHQLQLDLVSSKKSTSEALRTAKLISAKLGLDDIAAWIDLELGGYHRKDKLPPYRQFAGGEIFFWQEEWDRWKAGGFIDKQFPINEPIPVIEDLVKDDILHVPVADNNRVIFRTPRGEDHPINSRRQRFEVSSLHFKRVLETVRDRLLNWTIELEKRGIVGEDMSFNKSERESAKSQTFHIQNFTGNIGDVSDSHFQIYNYSSIHQQLKDCGVPKEERDELEKIMDDLSEAKPAAKPGLMQKGKAWIEKNQSFLGATANIVRKALGFEVAKN